jgi:hypothetical protein
LGELASSVEKCRAHYTRKDKINGSPLYKILREILGGVAVTAPFGRQARLGRLSYVHEYVVAADLDRIAIDPDGRVLHHFAGGNVVLPGVPGTGNYRPFQLALA